VSEVLTAGLLILRLVVGLTVAAHGAQKLFGWWSGPGLQGFGGMLHKLGIRPGAFWALVAAAGELAGGLLTALGLISPVGPLMIAGSMLVAIAAVHLPNGFWNGNRGYEFPLQILAVAVALSLTGYGPASLDAALRLRLPEPVTWAVVAAGVLLTVLTVLALPRLPRRAAAARPGLG
jgi:putative oxidoreductase